MPHLAVNLLGHFEVTLDGQPVPRFRTDKMRALLAYLAVEAERNHRRALLAGLLWPEFPEADARHNLSQTLLRLRQLLDKGTPPLFLATRQTLQLNPAGNTSVDVAAFQSESAVCACLAPEQLSAADAGVLTRAVARYQGDFLSTPLQVDSQAFEEWLLLTRIQLHLLALDTLDCLGQYHALCSEFGIAAGYARRQIELEPLREAAYRQLMEALAQDNRCSEALAQYAVCQNILAQDLGIAPAPETTALYERIKAARSRSAIPLTQRGKKPGTGPLVSSPPFVGRALQLSCLDEALLLALAGQGQVRFITGEAGSGKSALLDAFARRALAAHADLLVLNGAGNAYTGRGNPYWPFIEMLAQLYLSGSGGANMAAPLSDAQTQRLAAARPVVRRVFSNHGPDLGRLLGDRGDLSSDASNVQQSHLFAQTTRVLQAVAAQQHPLLLIMDDLQWADQDSLNFLFHLGRRLGDQRIVVVGAFRSAAVDGYPPFTLLEGTHDDGPAPSQAQQHPLIALVYDLQRYQGDLQIDLAQASGRDFIDALLDSEANHLGAAFRDTLYRHTGGHALFTTELLRGMQARGDLVRDARGFWTEGESVVWDALPARVEGTVAARINQLLPAWREMLTVASVEGDQFTVQVVARIVDLPEREVSRRLRGALSRLHDLVAPVGVHAGLVRYRFRHQLFQRYLYQRLDAVERAQLHLAVGRQLEALYGERASEFSLQLARHFELGGAVATAIPYLLTAGQRANRLAATEEAVRLLTHALALLKQLPKSPTRDQQEAALQLALGSALLSTGWAGDTREEAAERAYALCRHSGDPGQVRRSLLMLAYVNLARDQLAQADAAGKQLHALAQATQDPLTALFAQFVLGSVHYFKGDLLPARRHLERAVALYDAHTPTSMTLTGADVGVSSLVWLGEILWALGYADQALARSRQAITLAQAMEHTPSLDLALNVGALSVQHCRRDIPALRAALRQADGVHREASSSMFRFWGALFQGWLAVMDGHDPRGLIQIQEAIRQWEATGTRVGHIHYYMLLAEAYLALGQVETAQVMLERVLADIETTGHHFFEAEIFRLKGEAERALGRLDEAVACFRQAIAAARKQSAKAWELRAVLSLCRLYQAIGQVTQLTGVRAQLAEVYGGVTEGLDTPDLQEAKALLS
jgi:DNA-binding SARP family transcriptional activator/tetratricopeptide (TPR) repeat protein